MATVAWQLARRAARSAAELKGWFEMTLHRAMAFVGAGAIGAGIGWSLTHLGEPLAWVGVGVAAAIVASIVASAVGMKRRRGSRFQLMPGFLLRAEHPWRKMASEDAEPRWLALSGVSGLTLESGWTCDTCSMMRFVVRSLDDRRCHVLLNMSSGPWLQWGAGLFFAFGSDPRAEFAETADG